MSTIGFLGAGRMATALGKGFVSAGRCAADGLFASDVLKGARDQFARETGGHVSASNFDIVAAAGVLVVAVKPDQVVEILGEIRGQIEKRHLLGGHGVSPVLVVLLKNPSGRLFTPLKSPTEAIKTPYKSKLNVIELLRFRPGAARFQNRGGCSKIKKMGLTPLRLPTRTTGRSVIRASLHSERSLLKMRTS